MTAHEQPDLGFTINEPVTRQPDLKPGRRVEATAHGIPKPQGNMTAQVIRKGPRTGQLAVFHRNEHLLLPWREALIYALRAAHGGEPMAGPVGVHVVFSMPKPKSAPKRRHVWPAKKPDLDKLLRGVLDATTYAGVWRDDSQVVMATCSKHYVGDGFPHVMPSPGAYVHIWEINA